MRESGPNYGGGTVGLICSPKVSKGRAATSGLPDQEFEDVGSEATQFHPTQLNVEREARQSAVNDLISDAVMKKRSLDPCDYALGVSRVGWQSKIGLALVAGIGIRG